MLENTNFIEDKTRDGLLHCGVYVSDLNQMTRFYKEVFDMQIVCSEAEDSGAFLDTLLGLNNSKILVTKLITPRGRITGVGEMIELIKIVLPEKIESGEEEKSIYARGVVHMALHCSNIEKTVKEVVSLGGKIIVAPFKRDNGNWLCFVCDPEGNYIELIQRK